MDCTIVNHHFFTTNFFKTLAASYISYLACICLEVVLIYQHWICLHIACIVYIRRFPALPKARNLMVGFCHQQFQGNINLDCF